MDKKNILEILKQYLFNSIEAEIGITDERPEGVYLPSEGDYWFCHIPNPPKLIGESRVIAISKETGDVVFDGYCGE